MFRWKLITLFLISFGAIQISLWAMVPGRTDAAHRARYKTHPEFKPPFGTQFLKIPHLQEYSLYWHLGRQHEDSSQQPLLLKVILPYFPRRRNPWASFTETEERSPTVHVQTGLRTHMITLTAKYIVARSKTAANVQTGAVQPLGKYSAWVRSSHHSADRSH